MIKKKTALKQKSKIKPAWKKDVKAHIKEILFTFFRPETHTVITKVLNKQTKLINKLIDNASKWLVGYINGKEDLLQLPSLYITLFMTLSGDCYIMLIYKEGEGEKSTRKIVTYKADLESGKAVDVLDALPDNQYDVPQLTLFSTSVCISNAILDMLYRLLVEYINAQEKTGNPKMYNKDGCAKA